MSELAVANVRPSGENRIQWTNWCAPAPRHAPTGTRHPRASRAGRGRGRSCPRQGNCRRARTRPSGPSCCGPGACRQSYGPRRSCSPWSSTGVGCGRADAAHCRTPPPSNVWRRSSTWATTSSETAPTAPLAPRQSRLFTWSAPPPPKQAIPQAGSPRTGAFHLAGDRAEQSQANPTVVARRRQNQGGPASGLLMACLRMRVIQTASPRSGI